MLKIAFVQGRLTKDELDARAGQALTAQTHAQLAAVTADIPAGIARSEPPAKPVHAPVRTSVRVMAAATMTTAAAWARWLADPDNKTALNLVVTFTVIWLGIVILTGAVLLDARLRRRSARQLPPRRPPLR